MSFIQNQWEQALRNAAQLHEDHVNPQMMQVLRIIGFDKTYVKAEGCKLWDKDGNDYLDFLAGYSVFNLGHNNSELIEVLRDTLGSSWPNMIQMDAPPLSGKLAEELTDRDPTGRLQYAYFGN
jgi:4-aminobutyrate aminotransferase-like enzyme